MSEKRIIEHARDEVPRGRTDWARLRAMTEDEIEANAASDPDNQPLSDEALAAGEAVFPQDRTKVPVYIRLDREVVSYYKAQGPGYQTRINADLLRLVRSRPDPQSPRKPLRAMRGTGISAWDAARPARAHLVRGARAPYPAVPSMPRAG